MTQPDEAVTRRTLGVQAQVIVNHSPAQDIADVLFAIHTMWPDLPVARNEIEPDAPPEAGFGVWLLPVPTEVWERACADGAWADTQVVDLPDDGEVLVSIEFEVP